MDRPPQRIIDKAHEIMKGDIQDDDTWITIEDYDLNIWVENDGTKKADIYNTQDGNTLTGDWFHLL